MEWTPFRLHTHGAKDDSPGGDMGEFARKADGRRIFTAEIEEKS